MYYMYEKFTSGLNGVKVYSNRSTFGKIGKIASESVILQLIIGLHVRKYMPVFAIWHRNVTN